MQVVAEKKWREVGSVFRFSATTTSASFVLRKHYRSLLYHYEQVHFFRVKGPLYTPSAGPSLSPLLLFLIYIFIFTCMCALGFSVGFSCHWQNEIHVYDL